jgi:hypothetical protein
MTFFITPGQRVGGGRSLGQGRSWRMRLRPMKATTSSKMTAVV